MKSGHLELGLQQGPFSHRLTAVLRTHRWLAVQAVVLVPLAAAVLSLRQAPAYRAQAQVLVGSRADGSAPQPFAKRSVRIARRRAVARAAVAAAGVVESPRRFLAHSSAAMRPGSHVLALRVVSGSRALAARLARAYATAYALYRRDLRLAPAATVVAAAPSVRQVAPQVLRNTLLALLAGLGLGAALAFAGDALGAATAPTARRLTIVPPLPARRETEGTA